MKQKTKKEIHYRCKKCGDEIYWNTHKSVAYCKCGADVQEREIEFILATIKGIYSSPIPERGREKITEGNLEPLNELLLNS